MVKAVSILLTLLFCCCKKDHTCSCVLKNANNAVYNTYEEKYTRRKTKKQAVADCNKKQALDQESNTQACYNCSITVECELTQ
jgi:hypothetical protein